MPFLILENQKLLLLLSVLSKVLSCSSTMAHPYVEKLLRNIRVDHKNPLSIHKRKFQRNGLPETFQFETQLQRRVSEVCSPPEILLFVRHDNHKTLATVILLATGRRFWVKNPYICSCPDFFFVAFNRS